MVRLELEQAVILSPVRPTPWLSLMLSTVSHAAFAGILLSIPTQTFGPSNPNADGIFTKIVIDKKVYYVMPLAAQKATREAKNAPPAAPAAPRSAASAPEAAPAEARPAKVARQFIPPDVRKNPALRETLVQADLMTVQVAPEIQVPSLQAWTGRLAPYRRTLVVPGQKTPQTARSVDLDDLPPPNPVVVSSGVFPREAKLQLAPPPTVVNEDLPALEFSTPGLSEGNPINVIASTLRPPTEDLLLPPENVVGKNEDAPQLPTRSATPAPTPAKPGGGTGTSGGGFQGRGATSAPSGPAAGGPSPASAVVVPPPASAKEVVTAGPNGSTAITRSPEGRFDAIVVQSSPLDQFPSGNTLLKGRPIYTVYVPVGTAKDWTLYLCAITDGPSPTTQTAMEPPYPYKLLRPRITIPTYQKYLLVHGVVTETGTVREVRVIPPVNQNTADLVVAAVSQWTFRPAKQQGVAIATEFVLSIPAGSF